MRRQHLAEEIEGIFRSSGRTYGSPRVFIELVRRGWRVSVNTVARLMSALGPDGRKRRRRRSPTRPGKRPAAPDFVKRDFTCEEPDLVRVGDMTEIDTGEGKLYLATVIDPFSRRAARLRRRRPRSSRSRRGSGSAPGRRPGPPARATRTITRRRAHQAPRRRTPPPRCSPVTVPRAPRRHRRTPGAGFICRQVVREASVALGPGVVRKPLGGMGRLTWCRKPGTAR